jgi:hypothetical protein
VNQDGGRADSHIHEVDGDEVLAVANEIERQVIPPGRMGPSSGTATDGTWISPALSYVSTQNATTGAAATRCTFHIIFGSIYGSAMLYVQF